ncbi:MAG: transporter [Gemmatimonadaceae bacterium]
MQTRAVTIDFGMPQILTAARAAVHAIALSAATLILVPAVAFAQSQDSVTAKPDSINPRAALPERPTVATHAYTIAPGYVEIETGVQVAQPTVVSQFVAPIVVKIGVVPRLQLEIQGGYSRMSAPGISVSGVTDLAFALKQRLLDNAPILHDFSVQAAVKFPTGSTNVTTTTTDASILLISSRPIGAAELDLNAGYTRRSGNGSIAPINATLLTASFGTPIAGPLGGVAEVFSNPATTGPAGTATSVGFLFGPTYQVQPSLVLDAGAILNVRNMTGNAIYAGVTYNVGRIPGFPATR